MQGEDPIVSVRPEKGVARHGELDPHQHGAEAGEAEKEECGAKVASSDEFVIDGGQPGPKPGWRFPDSFESFREGCHDVLSSVRVIATSGFRDSRSDPGDPRAPWRSPAS